MLAAGYSLIGQTATNYEPRVYLSLTAIIVYATDAFVNKPKQELSHAQRHRAGRRPNFA
jgi:hypothetical protein